MRSHTGFTLIEVLIVLVLIAVLSAIALPSYRDYVVRGRIPEATAQLAAKQVQMEQWFQDSRSYLKGTECGIGISDPAATRYFVITCEATSTTYKITATGVGSMAGFVYTVVQDGTKATTATPAGWQGSTTCWVTAKGGVC